MTHSDTINKYLANRAQDIISNNLNRLSESLNGNNLSTKLQPFTTNNLGNFPYIWLSPNNLTFNQKTYRWISSSLKKNITSVQLGTPFTNLYIQALAAVSYRLSKADTKKLNTASQNIEHRQATLLYSWRINIIGEDGQRDRLITIKQVIETITKTWATPPTTLLALQQTSNLKNLLNKAPENGEPVVIVLSSYLNTLNSVASLVNASPRNTGYLAQALAAVQSPSIKNGGLLTTNTYIHPAYEVSPSVGKIVQALNSSDKGMAFTLQVSLACQQEGQCTVSMGDAVKLVMATRDALDITLNDDKNFTEKVADTGSTIEAEVNFTGITMVYFDPASFDMPTKTNWYWMKPIIEAIENKDEDVSGFNFSPYPNIDFSMAGPFGFLTGIAISKTPSITIKIKNPNYKNTVKQILAAKSIKLNFLDRIKNTLITDPDSIVTDDTNGIITLKFGKTNLKMANSMDSTAFVLGVQTSYPAAQK